MSVEGWVQGDAARQRLALVLSHARRAMIATTVLSAVLNVLLLSGSLYMMLVYDMVLPSNSIPTLVGLAVLVLVAYAFQGVLILSAAGCCCISRRRWMWT